MSSSPLSLINEYSYLHTAYRPDYLDGFVLERNRETQDIGLKHHLPFSAQHASVCFPYYRGRGINANESNERLDRIEANLDRLTALTLNTAERESAIEHQMEQLGFKFGDFVRKIAQAAATAGENIRALAWIAEAHERRN